MGRRRGKTINKPEGAEDQTVPSEQQNVQRSSEQQRQEQQQQQGSSGLQQPQQPQQQQQQGSSGLQQPQQQQQQGSSGLQPLEQQLSSRTRRRRGKGRNETEGTEGQTLPTVQQNVQRPGKQQPQEQQQGLPLSGPRPQPPQQQQIRPSQPHPQLPQQQHHQFMQPGPFPQPSPQQQQIMRLPVSHPHPQQQIRPSEPRPQPPQQQQQIRPSGPRPQPPPQQQQQIRPSQPRPQPPQQQHHQFMQPGPFLQPSQQQQQIMRLPVSHPHPPQQQIRPSEPRPQPPQQQQQQISLSGPPPQSPQQQQMRTSAPRLPSVKQKPSKGQVTQAPVPKRPLPPAETSIQTVSESLSSLDLDVTKFGAVSQLPAGAALRPPNRKDFGASGKKISLSVNHFPVTIKKKTIYHYDVTITPKGNKATFREVVYQLFRSDERLKPFSPVFDGQKNMYSSGRIPGFDKEVAIKHVFQEANRVPSECRTFTITIKPTAESEIDLSAIDSYFKNGSSVNIPFRGIQALDIVLKYFATQRMVVSGNNLVSKFHGVGVLSDGVEAWFGHFQSLRLGWKPFLNVNAAQKPMLKAGLVHEVMASTFRKRVGEPLRPFEYDRFARQLRNMKVSYSRVKYEAKVGVNGLKGPANKESFEHDGKRITVQQYFEKEYNCKLNYPDLPCLWVGSKNKTILVPMEVCKILEGQEYRQQLSDNERRALLKYSATPADERKKKIEESVKSMNFSADEYCNNYGLSISCNMLQITGRVLPPPALAYGENEEMEINPRHGVWNMEGAKFVVAMPLDCWGVISVCRSIFNQNELLGFASCFQRTARDMGMRVADVSFVKMVQNPRDIQITMKQYKNQFPKLQILFVVIERKGAPEYEIVKRIGDTELFITTQCIQARNVGGGRPQIATVANICLKVNAKLGGINNLIDRRDRPKMLLNEQVIILGADVTHPGAEQPESGKPSIAAVVGSVDPRASQYCAEIRMQKSKQEYIEDMEGMVYNILRKFNSVAGKTSTGKPQRIIFFRDGVSEGQFAKILEHELSAIRKACMRLQNGYEPPITFIVVQKRHHTRLFPNDSRDAIGKSKNVPPGTVVDREIVHPTEPDFYLVSHNGIQGTSRPTKYHVIWDDNDMKADDIQQLAYYLCYMFSRCTRSVSYPAPCYYAHLVAYRGRQYYEGYKNLSNKELQQHVDETRNMQFMFFV